MMTIEELYNILLSNKPSDILKTKEDKFFELIPELQLSKGFDQHNEWHIYDVYEHILHVIDNVPSDIILRIAALFHDIGKPIAYTKDEKGTGHFYGHWEVSQMIFEIFANKHNIDQNISSRVSDLIYYHDINVSKLDNDKLNEMYQKLGVEGIIQLYELKKADVLAQNPKYHYILDEYNIQKENLLSMFKTNNKHK